MTYILTNQKVLCVDIQQNRILDEMDGTYIDMKYQYQNRSVAIALSKSKSLDQIFLNTKLQSKPLTTVGFNTTDITYFNVVQEKKRNKMFCVLNYTQIVVINFKSTHVGYTIVAEFQEHNKIVIAIFFKDGHWEVIYHDHNSTFIVFYSNCFNVQLKAPIRICDKVLSKSQCIVMGGLIFYVVGNSLYRLDIVSEDNKRISEYPRYERITYITSNNRIMILVFDNCTIGYIYLQGYLHMQTDFTAHTSDFCVENITFVVIENDIHSSSSLCNDSYVYKIPLKTVQPFIGNNWKTHTSMLNAHNITKSQNVYPCLHEKTTTSIASMFNSSPIFNEFIVPLLDENDAFKWEIWTKRPNVYELVDMQGESYLLYIHPITGFIHIVLEHPLFVNVLQTNSCMFISTRVCVNGKRRCVQCEENFALLN